MKTQPQHTPTPESVDMPMTTEAVGKLVAITDEVYRALKGKKPSFIVRAVNCHEELVKALRAISEAYASDGNTRRQKEAFVLVREAIAEAEGR